MMNRPFNQKLFEQLPIVGILRGFDLAQLEQIVNAAVRGGLRNLEVTMNSRGAPEQIARALELSEGQMNIGAGTVTSLDLLDEALHAGASFIVTPALQEEVVTACVKQDVPVFPGAFTPTEIYRAFELGAAMVKVFPAEVAGPAYIKAVRAPLPQVKLMPTGGVDLESLPAFIKAGALGFGVGSPLFQRARVEAEDWSWIEEQCQAFRRTYEHHARREAG